MSQKPKVGEYKLDVLMRAPEPGMVHILDRLDNIRPGPDFWPRQVPRGPVNHQAGATRDTVIIWLQPYIRCQGGDAYRERTTRVVIAPLKELSGFGASWRATGVSAVYNGSTELLAAPGGTSEAPGPVCPQSLAKTRLDTLADALAIPQADSAPVVGIREQVGR